MESRRLYIEFLPPIQGRYASRFPTFDGYISDISRHFSFSCLLDFGVCVFLSMIFENSATSDRFNSFQVFEQFS